MKSSPVLPGGSLPSKPTWPNTIGCSATSAFLFSVEIRPREVSLFLLTEATR